MHIHLRSVLYTLYLCIIHSNETYLFMLLQKHLWPLLPVSVVLLFWELSVEKSSNGNNLSIGMPLNMIYQLSCVNLLQYMYTMTYTSNPPLFSQFGRSACFFFISEENRFCENPGFSPSNSISHLTWLCFEHLANVWWIKLEFIFWHIVTSQNDPILY